MSRDAETLEASRCHDNSRNNKTLAWGNNPLESMGETYQVSLFLLLFFTTSFFVSIALPC